MNNFYTHSREIGFWEPKISFTYTLLVGQIFFRPKNSDLKHDPEIVFPLVRREESVCIFSTVNLISQLYEVMNQRVTLMAFDRLFTLRSEDFSFLISTLFNLFKWPEQRIDTFSRQKYVVIGKMEREQSLTRILFFKTSAVPGAVHTHWKKCCPSHS